MNMQWRSHLLSGFNKRRVWFLRSSKFWCFLSAYVVAFYRTKGFYDWMKTSTTLVTTAVSKDRTESCRNRKAMLFSVTLTSRQRGLSDTLCHIQIKTVKTLLSLSSFFPTFAIQSLSWRMQHYLFIKLQTKLPFIYIRCMFNLFAAKIPLKNDGFPPPQNGMQCLAMLYYRWKLPQLPLQKQRCFLSPCSSDQIVHIVEVQLFTPRSASVWKLTGNQTLFHSCCPRIISTSLSIHFQTQHF